MKTKFLLILSIMIIPFLLLGCSKNSDEASVYYLNFKPEQDAQWQELAEIYTAETGIDVVVVTAASGTYETTLESELSKTNAPTLFQVNGPVGLQSWSDYCYDLTDSDIVSELTSNDFVLYNDNEIAGVAYVIETYGLIYNKSLLSEAGYTQEDITSFDSLKTIVEDITARQDELGFAAFTSSGMDSSSDWRFKTHLANLPIYYEYLDSGINSTDAIQGTYLDEYQAIWDLYINNATVDSTQLSTMTGDDAIDEFISSEAVFYQNGTWAYSDICSIGDENLGMLPIYIGADDEENQGLCTGTENYWCVNKNASNVDIQATLDFINWCVTDEIAVTAMCGSEDAMPSGASGMGFVIPFISNQESNNHLVNIANEYVADGKISVTWNFTTMPSSEWKDAVGLALTAYAEGVDTWDAVETAFIDGWALEYAIINEK